MYNRALQKFADGKGVDMDKAAALEQYVDILKKQLRLFGANLDSPSAESLKDGQ